MPVEWFLAHFIFKNSVYAWVILYTYIVFLCIIGRGKAEEFTEISLDEPK